MKQISPCLSPLRNRDGSLLRSTAVTPQLPRSFRRGGGLGGLDGSSHGITYEQSSGDNTKWIGMQVRK